MMAISAFQGPDPFDSKANIAKSADLQDRKRTSEKMQAREKIFIQMGLKPGDRPFDTHSYMADEEDSFLTKIFPIFLICIGIVITLISIFSEAESSFPMYLGISVTVVAVIWHVLATIRSNKRKKNAFLRERLD